MVMFGLELEEDNKAKQFLRETNKRLTVSGNPFTKGYVKKIKSIYIINLEILFFRIYWLGYCLLAGALYIKGFMWGWWLIPILLLISIHVFYTKWWQTLIFKAGIRKTGYKGNIKIIGDKELLKRLVYYG